MVPGYEIELVGKLLLAFVFGIVIGLDRERSGKPAGIRTQMLICVGSALLAGISVHLIDKFPVPHGTPHPDPARLMAQIVSGIGFVGAGVILKNHNKVSGVTTAATLWTTAAIGIAIGAEFYISAAFTTVLVLLLEPLALIQYRFGLKTYAYILKVPKSRWPKCLDLLSDLHIKYRVRKGDHENGQFVVYSSEEKKKMLSEKLAYRRIAFEMFEVED